MSLALFLDSLVCRTNRILCSQENVNLNLLRFLEAHTISDVCTSCKNCWTFSGRTWPFGVRTSNVPDAVRLLLCFCDRIGYDLHGAAIERSSEKCISFLTFAIS